MAYNQADQYFEQATDTAIDALKKQLEKYKGRTRK